MSYKVCLNVAEKPSVAKGVTQILSNGRFRSSKGLSKYNPVYEFDMELEGENCTMRFTSVLGHVKGINFPSSWSNWNETPFEKLYEAPMEEIILDSSKDVAKNLKNQSSGIDWLILWLDWDREGEGIAYEVISIVKERAKKIEIKRAHFSAVTQGDIMKAINSLTPPNPNLADAVFARQEIDLRIGASFTRFQSIYFKELLGIDSKTPVSYGPCQFPTLGFIVERYQRIRDFKTQKFWYLELKYEKEKYKVTFNWKRKRIFDKFVWVVIYQRCLEHKEAVITKWQKERKLKFRPQPLNTIQMQKLVSQKLKISSAKAMELAEKLYNKGYISYPRTETNRFSNTFNLKSIAKKQEGSSVWGDFAKKVVSGELYSGARNGKSDDKAHPPIHPVKAAQKEDLNFDEWRIYELVTRHFLATISKDAVGMKTTIEAQIDDEIFSATGIIVEELNWLEVYPYEKWTDWYLPEFKEKQKFTPTSFRMEESETCPPRLLTESDLLTIMDNNGIGTDATIHEHIKTVQDRGYAIKDNNEFKPTPIGLSLVEVYQAIDIKLYKPYLRAQMEKEMTMIANGEKPKADVLKDALSEMLKIFNQVVSLRLKMIDVLKSKMNESIKDKNLQKNPMLPPSKPINNENTSSSTSSVANLTPKLDAPNTFQPRLSNTAFAKCPMCKMSMMKFKATKKDTIFISWNGFPQWK
jgi:DNA topoisomerase III